MGGMVIVLVMLLNTAVSFLSSLLHQLADGFCSQQPRVDGFGVPRPPGSFAVGCALQIVVAAIPGLAGASHSRAMW
jgi:hypothetical protein